MNVKKPLLIAGLVGGIGVAGLGVSGIASAASNSSANPSDGLVSKIASTFNLDKSKVQAVFDAERTAKDTERQQAVETALTQAVKDGKLTEAQKSAILAKRAELKSQMEANRDSFKDKSDAERKAAMKTQRTELDKWASDNSIPSDYQHYVMGGPGGGHGGPGRGDAKPDDAN